LRAATAKPVAPTVGELPLRFTRLEAFAPIGIFPQAATV
jgi:hypothetical protein